MFAPSDRRTHAAFLSADKGKTWNDDLNMGGGEVGWGSGTDSGSGQCPLGVGRSI